MTNPNDPISPILSQSLADLPASNCSGLTKLEHFAGLAMQGLLADPDFNVCPEPAGVAAVGYARALIAALNAEEVR